MLFVWLRTIIQNKNHGGPCEIEGVFVFGGKNYSRLQQTITNIIKFKSYCLTYNTINVVRKLHYVYNNE